MLFDPRGPKGWLTQETLATLIAILILLISNSITHLLTKARIEKNLESRVESPSTQGFQEKKGEILKPGVLYDAGLEDSSIQLSKEKVHNATERKTLLYFRTSKALTKESRTAIRSKLDSIKYLTRVEVEEYGLVVEKLSTRGEDNREPKKILHPWKKIYDKILPLLQEAEFEPE